MTPSKIRLAIRGYAAGKQQFQDLVDIDPQDLEDLLPDLATKHAAALAGHTLHMIEIEFLDEPNVNERFFRLGTDPAGMVMPLKVDLTKPLDPARIWPRRPV